MKSIISLILSLMGCGLGFLGLSTGSQTLARNASGTGDENEPSPCLSEAVIRVTASPSTITFGQSTVVSCSVNLPNQCSAVHAKLNGQSVATSGSRSVSPARSMAFTVVVSETRLGVYGEKRGFTRVEVTYPPRVVIDRNTADPAGVLIGVLANSPNPEQTIELCDVDLDLTGHSGLIIRDNTSLIASPACARGPRRFGPRIFVTDTHRGSAALFEIHGDNVRVSGFRLEGPTSRVGSGDDNKEKAILISPTASAEPIHSIEISNMEIFHWSGVGVQVNDNVDVAERGRLFNTHPSAVHIKGNFFHHNRHDDGEGYGVDIANGAYALIEQNVFDENRHAIAGGSRNCSGKGNDYSGYTARDNLILTGGGLHCHIVCSHTHQIDMHGDGNAWSIGCGCKGGDHWYSANCSNWECGTAGETILIERNTILYTKGLAIKIRGNPADKAVVDGNVFRHPGNVFNHDTDDTIGQNGDCGRGDNISNPIDIRPNNVFGVDPTTELANCDFVGDGQQDRFMPTGVTWWAFSTLTNQWRYLNTMSQKLSELQLGDVDGDGVCDVALKARQAILPGKYSKSGTSPWLVRATQGPRLP